MTKYIYEFKFHCWFCRHKYGSNQMNFLKVYKDIVTLPHTITVIKPRIVFDFVLSFNHYEYIWRNLKLFQSIK